MRKIEEINEMIDNGDPTEDSRGPILGEGVPHNNKHADLCAYTYVCALPDGSVVYCDDSRQGESDGHIIITSPEDQDEFMAEIE